MATTVESTDSESLLNNVTFEYQNETQTVGLLHMCPHDTFDRCASGEMWKYVVSVLNVISVVVNIFHIIMLQKLPVLRGSACLLALQHISVTDLYSVTSAFSIFCFYHNLYYEKNILLGVLFASIREHSGYMRFNALAIASIERYLSLCHPQKGDIVCFKVWSRTQIIKVLMVGFCIGSLGFSVIKNFVFRKSLCLWALHGPSSIDSPRSSICLMSYILLMTSIIVICNFNVLMELRRATSQNFQQQQRRNNLARRGFFYVIIVNIAFYICIIPVTVLLMLGHLGPQILIVRWAVHLTFSFYGIFNVLIYGWILKPYRNLLQSIFTCSKNPDLGRPDVSAGSSKIGESAVKSVDTDSKEQSAET